MQLQLSELPFNVYRVAIVTYVLYVNIWSYRSQMIRLLYKVSSDNHDKTHTQIIHFINIQLSVFYISISLGITFFSFRLIKV